MRTIFGAVHVLWVIVILAGALSAGVSVAAEPAESPWVRPGDGAVTGTRLEPYESAWTYIRRAPDGELTFQGRWTDRLTVEGAGAERVLTRRQEIQDPGVERVLINRFRARDMRPLSFELQSAEGQTMTRVEFEDKALRVFAAGQEDPQVVPLAEPVFDWFLYGLLVAAFPLDEGYQVRFPALSTVLSPVTRHLTVLGKELVPGPGGNPTPCWKTEGDEGLTFWISENAPYVLRVLKQVPDGSTVSRELERGAQSGGSDR